ncbi:hypothetical protein WS0980 [Wolinella succinogenes]|uniref:Uncharacterized protein n=1 Tax=Wolinella succinogenes (strain ATCC 29543 / DSM 1740 / CCUG 13145 / JCM 31913 / LMG 7466 / NCTC 11488 / FDC 602W) TaxID=273121 RepID=Q7MRW9_WOLSU|nr:hypothetical protein WS0980 [Wolinella succinogenes]
MHAHESYNPFTPCPTPSPLLASCHWTLYLCGDFRPPPLSP